jgi:4-hydroxy-3-methylbut-2-enyl diphosphate reductase
VSGAATPDLGPGPTLDPLALLAQLRAGGDRLELPGLRIDLAEAFGFCQGVEHAVDRALAAARELAAPAAAATVHIWMTDEIIHNPAIHAQLVQAGVLRLPPPGTAGRLAQIRAQDMVIVPAFGIDVDEELQLRRIGCRIVDTTCGWVRRVWRAARVFSADGLTVVIHGKREHEETRATASRIDGPWIVVRDRDAADRLAAWVERPPAGLPPQIASSANPGFDPLLHLARLGLVNQTTMLSAETRAIAASLRAALARRLGHPPGQESFRELDTFCPATQRRQDAVRALIEKRALDRLIVVGGLRSSNTAHLARIGQARVPTYHVEDAGCLIDIHQIRHLPHGATEPVTSTGWWPPAPRAIGVTAGASTPDLETGRILARLLALHAAGDP